MTLAADAGAYFLACGHLVDVVAGNALGGLERAHARPKRRTGDAQMHALRIMAVDAGDGMLGVLASFWTFHVIDDLEALKHVAVPELIVDRDHGCVAVQAGAG